MKNKDTQQIDNLHKQGLALLRSRHLTEAREVFTRICGLSPEDADAWHKLANIHGMLGDIHEAGTCCRKVIALRPDHSEAHTILGNVLLHQGSPEEAISHYQIALRIDPGNAVAHNNLGNALKSTGRLDEAFKSYQHAIAVNPKYALAHFNIGVALKEAGRLQEAGDSFRRAIALNTNYAEAYNNLGIVLKQLGCLEEARTAIQRALTIKPKYAEAIYNLANILMALGRLEPAIAQFRQSILLKPDYADAYNNLGNAFKELGQIEPAMENYRHAISLNPQHTGAYNNLAVIFRDRNRINAAEEMVQNALRIQPDYADAYITLGNIRSWQGKPGDAVAMYEKALQLSPDHVMAHSNLLMTMNYLPRYSAQDLLTTAKDWSAQHACRISGSTPPANTPDPNRRLRIGYVSGDFCSHPVGFFTEAVLAHHDKRQHEIFCYYNRSHQDDVTARLRKGADHWRVIAGQSDQDVIAGIRRDGIDILVDLSGHTQGHRLLVFSQRPAPVQLTWMGYFATTGAAGVDYIIADPYVIPPQEECHYSERVERLPHSYLCFTPPDLDIPVAPLPALSQGAVTFGCFNNPAKMTAQVIACWSHLLHTLPDARLHLKYRAFEDDGVVRDFQGSFAAHGIAAERIRFSGVSPRKEYFASHNEIDIGLDPFPFGGCTTTVDALWMGVPVVTLRGDRFAGHMGETIMMNLGQPECVADGVDDYVQKAVALARDLPRLADLRSGLRKKLLNSSLCDGATFTRDLESVYRRLWTDWCNGQHSTGL